MTRGRVAATNNSKQQSNKQQSTYNVQRMRHNRRQHGQREQQELFNNNKNKWKEHVVGGSSSQPQQRWAMWLYGYMAMAIAPGQGSGVSGWQSGKVVWHKVWCRVDCGSYVIGMPFCMWLGVTKQQPITKYEKWQLATKAQKKKTQRYRN